MSKIKSLLLAALVAALPLVAAVPAHAETPPCTINPDDDCPQADPQVIVPGGVSTLT